MFLVGLEATVPAMMRTGWPALRVAIAGVLLPMGLCWAYARFAMPVGPNAAVFIGACLVATSIGITARVLRERGALEGDAGRIILGAAVLDDVLGLIVLMLVSAVAGAGGAGEPAGILAKIAVALMFLVLALLLGPSVGHRVFRVASRLRAEQLLLPVSLAFCFLLAWLGTLAGLAAIVGAYAAGLILEPASYLDLESREKHSLESLVHPLVTAFAPVFFVAIGASVEIERLFTPQVLLAALCLAGLGTLGKWLAGFAAGRGLPGSMIGWGMVPRGEVGLIFVAVGARLPALDGGPLLSPAMQAALVAAILLTTLIGPVGLSAALRRAGGTAPAGA
jgi:Kef-type K+ transport system membrane component KefB